MFSLVNALEEVTGIDLDGDGSVGITNSRPNGGGGHHARPTTLGAGPVLFGLQRAHMRPGRPLSARNADPPQPFVPYQVRAPYHGGKVRALFIGINYAGTSAELRGCVNDVSTMLHMLESIQFPIQEACVLVDEPFSRGPSAMPTKANIMAHMRWLVSDARPGDTFFFTFSGHGGQVYDVSGDESDGMDETLIPCDWKTAGEIIDDDIFTTLVAPLPAGVRMTAVVDACNSGTAFDLPFSFVATDASMCSRTSQVMRGKKGFEHLNENSSVADVVMLSGCKDGQTSADVSGIAAQAGGACTNALAHVMTKTTGLTFSQLLEEMRKLLKARGHSQVPQMSSTKPIDLSKPFSLFGSLQATSNYIPYAPVAQPSVRIPPPPQSGGYNPAAFYHPQAVSQPYPPPVVAPYPPMPGAYPPPPPPPGWQMGPPAAAPSYPPVPPTASPPPQYPVGPVGVMPSYTPAGARHMAYTAPPQFPPQTTMPQNTIWY